MTLALNSYENIEDIEDIEDIGKPTGGFVEPAPAGFLLPGVRTRIIWQIMGKKRCLQVKKCKEERKINPAAAKKKTF